MLPADFDDLQAIWQASDPAVDERVEAASRRVVRRQHLLEVFEIFLGFCLILFVMVTSLNVGTVTAAGVGLGISLLVIYSAWSRFRLRRIEELVDVRGQHAYLIQLLISARARLRRLIAGLALFVPGLALGNLFASITGLSDEQLREFLHITVPGGAIGAVFFILATTILPIWFLIRGILRQRKKIAQLLVTIEDFEASMDEDAFAT